MPASATRPDQPQREHFMPDNSYDLVIVGAGSGNMLPDKELEGWRIALVEADRFGGTCLNRGCIPSKILVHTADIAQEIHDAERFGNSAKFSGADWPAIRSRVFGRIDPVHEKAVAYRRAHGSDVFIGEARFVGPKVLRVGNEEVRGDRFVLAAGSRPSIPQVDGLASVPFLTSDNVMRLDKLPRSMVVLGGGYIAAEMSHIFGSLGTTATHVSATRKGVRLSFVTAAGGAQTVDGEVLLVATGRVPNGDQLDVAAAGIETDAHGHVRTDETYATTVPGIWALGDLANHFQLKHMANAEARLIRHNLLHEDQPRRLPFNVVPSAVFAGPQVASVGATEQELQARGKQYRSATRHYRNAAFGWALEDTSSFVKILADPASRLLLGAHIIGPQASTIIQPLIQAMCLANTVGQLASDVLYIHPALTEVVEQALLEL